MTGFIFSYAIFIADSSQSLFIPDTVIGIKLKSWLLTNFRIGLAFATIFWALNVSLAKLWTSETNKNSNMKTSENKRNRKKFSYIISILYDIILTISVIFNYAH
jgi:hypothetical protein